MRAYTTINSVLLYVVLLISNQANSLAAVNNPITINIILSAYTSPYQEVADSIKETLLRSQEFDYQFNVGDIDYFSKQQYTSSPQPDSALNISIGSKATAYAVPSSSSIPLISSFIPKHTYQRILEKVDRQSLGHIAGAVFIDQPLGRQILLATFIDSSSRNVGIPVGPISAETIQKEDALFHEYALQFRTAKIVDEGFDQSEMKNMIENSDVLLVIPDPLVNKPSNAKWLLYNAYYSNIPIVAFSQSYVKAGAVASIYSTPRLIGRQVAEYIKDYIGSDMTKRKANEYAKYFKISINRSVATGLGLKLPEEPKIEKKIQQAKSALDYVIKDKE